MPMSPLQSRLLRNPEIKRMCSVALKEVTKPFTFNLRKETKLCSKCLDEALPVLTKGCVNDAC